MNRLWQNMAGVYYPGEKPPAHVTLAKGVDSSQAISPARLKKRAIPIPKPVDASTVAAKEQRQAAIVESYRRLGSMAKVRRDVHCGGTTIYRALRAAGVEVPPAGRRRVAA